MRTQPQTALPREVDGAQMLNVSLLEVAATVPGCLAAWPWRYSELASLLLPAVPRGTVVAGPTGSS